MLEQARNSVGNIENAFVVFLLIYRLVEGELPHIFLMPNGDHQDSAACVIGRLKAIREIS